MNSANVALVLHLHTPYNIKEEEKKTTHIFYIILCILLYIISILIEETLKIQMCIKNISWATF